MNSVSGAVSAPSRILAEHCILINSLRNYSNNEGPIPLITNRIPKNSPILYFLALRNTPRSISKGIGAWRIRPPFSSISTFHHAKQIYHEKERGSWRVEEGVAHSVDPTGSARRSTERGRSPTGSNERSDRDGHVRANCTRQACMLRQRASLSLSSRRTYRFVLVHARGRVHIRVYTFTNTRMADAPRPRYTFLSLSDRLNPRPVFLFKVRAFVRNGFRVVRRFDRCASTVSIAFNGFSIVVTFSNLPRSRVSRYLLLRR